MKIGVVVHDPEIIDRGCALLLINYLKKRASVEAVLGGTMGRVAVIDAGLEDVITTRRRPSQSIQDLQAASDVIFLLNQAKSRESGLAFGAMVAKAAGTAKPLMQIDCGGRFVAVLSGKEGEGRCEGAVLIDHWLGIPIIGIVDGDLDRLAASMVMLPGSVVIQVLPGHDDLVGRQVKAEIFQGERRICIGADDLVKRIKILAEDCIILIDLF